MHERSEHNSATAIADPPQSTSGVRALHHSESQSVRAIRDIVTGARAVRMWGMLGWHDVRLRYRRSTIGPFWLTISMGVLIAALSTVYGALLRADTENYVPYLALGFVVWGLMSSLINDACTVFIRAQGIIKEVSLPLSVHVYRLVWRNVIVFLHNSVVIVVVSVLYSIWPGWNGLLSLLGLVLVCGTGAWVGLFLGIVCARFRDIPPIVASAVRISFFLTPILWMPEMWPHRSSFLDFNPFYHYLEVVRAPLLGTAPQPLSWLVVFGITTSGWILALLAFRRYRSRIAYWI